MHTYIEKMRLKGVTMTHEQTRNKDYKVMIVLTAKQPNQVAHTIAIAIMRDWTQRT